MAKDNWGIKRVCLSCAARFYDFNKSPITCPACNSLFDPEYLYKKKPKSAQEKSQEVDDPADIVGIVDGDLIDESSEDINVLNEDEDENDNDISLDDEKN
ncbi:MAG: TIGR02300 family protein [Holosporaceae bacterium]|jgi:uncharacterized protein (TIGR02300 family)|nr:TIGR02300 family protein [Holosporaceae bacterium]